MQDADMEYNVYRLLDMTRTYTNLHIFSGSYTYNLAKYGGTTKVDAYFARERGIR